MSKPAPHSFSTVTLLPPKPAANEMQRRFGNYAKGTVLPETHVPVSPRRRVADFSEGEIPTKFIEALEQNQLIASCCRHPENHEIESLKSHPDEPVSDIYIFHCGCGRKHRRLCVGFSDPRPEWK